MQPRVHLPARLTGYPLNEGPSSMETRPVAADIKACRKSRWAGRLGATVRIIQHRLDLQNLQTNAAARTSSVGRPGGSPVDSLRGAPVEAQEGVAVSTTDPPRLQAPATSKPPRSNG